MRSLLAYPKTASLMPWLVFLVVLVAIAGGDGDAVNAVTNKTIDDGRESKSLNGTTVNKLEVGSRQAEDVPKYIYEKSKQPAELLRNTVPSEAKPKSKSDEKEQEVVWVKKQKSSTVVPMEEGKKASSKGRNLSGGDISALVNLAMDEPLSRDTTDMALPSTATAWSLASMRATPGLGPHPSWSTILVKSSETPPLELGQLHMVGEPTSKPPTSKPPTSKPSTSKPPTSKPSTRSTIKPNITTTINMEPTQMSTTTIPSTKEVNTSINLIESERAKLPALEKETKEITAPQPATENSPRDVFPEDPLNGISTTAKNEKFTELENLIKQTDTAHESRDKNSIQDPFFKNITSVKESKIQNDSAVVNEDGHKSVEEAKVDVDAKKVDVNVREDSVTVGVSPQSTNTIPVNEMEYTTSPVTMEPSVGNVTERVVVATGRSTTTEEVLGWKKQDSTTSVSSFAFGERTEKNPSKSPVDLMSSTSEPTTEQAKEYNEVLPPASDGVSKYSLPIVVRLSTVPTSSVKTTTEDRLPEDTVTESQANETVLFTIEKPVQTTTQTSVIPSSSRKTPGSSLSTSASTPSTTKQSTTTEELTTTATKSTTTKLPSSSTTQRANVTSSTSTEIPNYIPSKYITEKTVVEEKHDVVKIKDTETTLVDEDENVIQILNITEVNGHVINVTTERAQRIVPENVTTPGSIVLGTMYTVHRTVHITTHQPNTEDLEDLFPLNETDLPKEEEEDEKEEERVTGLGKQETSTKAAGTRPPNTPPTVTDTDDGVGSDEGVVLRLVMRTGGAQVCRLQSELREAIVKLFMEEKREVLGRQVVVAGQNCREGVLDDDESSLQVSLTDLQGRIDPSLTSLFISLWLRDGLHFFPYPVVRVEKIASRSIPVEDMDPEEETQDSTSSLVAAIVMSSVAALCLLIVSMLLLIIRKRQKGFNYGQRCTPVSLEDYSLDNISVYNSVRRKAMRTSKRSYGNPAFDDPGAVSHVVNFATLASFVTNRGHIDEEFSLVPLVTVKPDELPAGVESKNRYANVIPLPETRVSLGGGDPHSSAAYINANFVKGPKGEEKFYIACQGPMADTVSDFWQMIWEQQSRMVIMLTDLYESGVEKCADYLPPSEVLDCHRVFGDLQVTLKKREVKEKYVISNLQLKNLKSNLWREVVHLWYGSWPVTGVPREQSSMIAMLIEARSYMRSKESHSPVVVHCSPGTGRTGTLIACDILIRHFEIKRTIDVPTTVYAIRRDRAGAVQTKDQYAFIYQVLHLYATKLTGGGLDSI